MPLNGENIFVGLANSGIYLSTNNGKSWASDTTGLGLSSMGGSINALAINGNKIFAGIVGNGNNIYLSTNNGTSWLPVNTGLHTNTPINCIAFDKNYIYIGGYGYVVGQGGIYKRSLSSF